MTIRVCRICLYQYPIWVKRCPGCEAQTYDNEKRDEETNDHWSLRDAGRDYDGYGQSYSERQI
jgi:hypothetical protein